MITNSFVFKEQHCYLPIGTNGNHRTIHSEEAIWSFRRCCGAPGLTVEHIPATFPRPHALARLGSPGVASLTRLPVISDTLSAVARVPSISHVTCDTCHVTRGEVSRAGGAHMTGGTRV